uniref:Aurora kinase(Incomplete catalytic triad),putative n=1 Tax=Neospora caninum (strain Liverpool) TaxID=572307 RepID=A0A0F7U604_NEOCL|nr:TPA: Aurora kinase(incomplete catalytic triad),putative [Neospora caninum Liverpool]
MLPPPSRAAPASRRQSAAPPSNPPPSSSSAVPSLDSRNTSSAVACDCPSSLVASSLASLPSFLSDENAGTKTHSSPSLLPVPVVTSFPSQKHSEPFLQDAASGLASRVFSGLLAASSALLNTTLSHSPADPPRGAHAASAASSYASPSCFSATEKEKSTSSVLVCAAAWLPHGGGTGEQGQGAAETDVFDLEAGRREEIARDRKQGDRSERWRGDADDRKTVREEGQQGRRGGEDPRRPREVQSWPGSNKALACGTPRHTFAPFERSQNPGETRNERDKSAGGSADRSMGTDAVSACLRSRARLPLPDEERFHSPRDACASSSSLLCTLSSSSTSFSSVHASASSSSRAGSTDSTQQRKRRYPPSPLENAVPPVSDEGRARDGRGERPVEEGARRRRDDACGDARRTSGQERGRRRGFSQKEERRPEGQTTEERREDEDRTREGGPRQRVEDEAERMKKSEHRRRQLRSSSLQERHLWLLEDREEPRGRREASPRVEAALQIRRKTENETLIFRQERRHLIWLHNRRQQEGQNSGRFNLEPPGRPAAEAVRASQERGDVHAPPEEQRTARRRSGADWHPELATDARFSFPEQREARASRSALAGRARAHYVRAWPVDRGEHVKKEGERGEEIRGEAGRRQLHGDQESPDRHEAGDARPEPEKGDTQLQRLPREEETHGRVARETAMGTSRVGCAEWPTDAGCEGQLPTATSEERRRSVADKETSRSEREAGAGRSGSSLATPPLQKNWSGEACAATARRGDGIRSKLELKRQLSPSVPPCAFPASSARRSAPRPRCAEEKRGCHASQPARTALGRCRDVKEGGGEGRKPKRECVSREAETPSREQPASEPFLPRVALLGAARGRELRSKREEERREKQEKTRQSSLGPRGSHASRQPPEKGPIRELALKHLRPLCAASFASCHATRVPASTALSRGRTPEQPSASVAASRPSVPRARDTRRSPSCPSSSTCLPSFPSASFPSSSFPSASVDAASSSGPSTPACGVARPCQSPSACRSSALSGFAAAGATGEHIDGDSMRSPSSCAFPTTDFPGKNAFPAYPLCEDAGGWTGRREDAHDQIFSFFSHVERSRETTTATDARSSPRFGIREETETEWTEHPEVAGEAKEAAFAHAEGRTKCTSFGVAARRMGRTSHGSGPRDEVREAESGEPRGHGAGTAGDHWFSPHSEREEVSGQADPVWGSRGKSTGDVEEKRGEAPIRETGTDANNGERAKRQADESEAKAVDPALWGAGPSRFGGQWPNRGGRSEGEAAREEGAGKQTGSAKVARGAPSLPTRRSGQQFRGSAETGNASHTRTVPVSPGTGGSGGQPRPTLRRPFPISSLALEGKERVSQSGGVLACDVSPRFSSSAGPLPLVEPLCLAQADLQAQAKNNEDFERRMETSRQDAGSRMDGRILGKPGSQVASQAASRVPSSRRCRDTAEEPNCFVQERGAKGSARPDAKGESARQGKSGGSGADLRDAQQTCVGSEKALQRKRLRSPCARSRRGPEMPDAEGGGREKSRCPSVGHASTRSLPSSSASSSLSVLSPDATHGCGGPSRESGGKMGEAARRSNEGRREVDENGREAHEAGGDGRGRATAYLVQKPKSETRDRTARAGVRPPVPPKRSSHSIGRDTRAREAESRDREDGKEGSKARCSSSQPQLLCRTHLQKRPSETVSSLPSRTSSNRLSFRSSLPSLVPPSSSSSSCSALPPVQKRRCQPAQKPGLPPAPRPSSALPRPSGCRARRPFSAVVQNASVCPRSASVISSQRPSSFLHSVSYLEWLSQSGFEAGSSSRLSSAGVEKEPKEQRQVGGTTGQNGDRGGSERTAGRRSTSSALHSKASRGDKTNRHGAAERAKAGDEGRRQRARKPALDGEDEERGDGDAAGGKRSLEALALHAEGDGETAFEEGLGVRPRGKNEPPAAKRSEPRIEDFCADGDLPIGCGRTGTVHRARCVGGPLLERLLRFRYRARGHAACPSSALGLARGRDEEEERGRGEITREGERRTEEGNGFPDSETVAAIKVLSKATIAQLRIREQIKKERDIHLRLEHPNIVRFFSSFEDDQQLYFVLEYANGGTLRDRLKRCERMQETEAAHLVFQLADALCYLHGKGIIHRDLKPENLLLHFDVEEAGSLSPDPREPDAEPGNKREPLCGETANCSNAVRPSSLYRFGQLKIADFGFACYCPSPSREASFIDKRPSSSSPFSSPSPSSSSSLRLLSATHKRTTFCGTATYLAPEIVRKEPYDMRIDLWCLGVCLYELLMGRPPFVGDSKEALFNQICELTDLPFHPSVSHEARSLILRLCSKDADERPSAAEVLADPWILRYLALNDVRHAPGPEKKNFLESARI